MLTWTASQRETSELPTFSPAGVLVSWPDNPARTCSRGNWRRRRLNPRRGAATQLRSAMQLETVPDDLGVVTSKAC
jgi:hypothetical protein